MPALDDEFAKDLGLESLDLLNKQIRENLESEAKQATDTKTRTADRGPFARSERFRFRKARWSRQKEHLFDRQRNRFIEKGQFACPKEELDKYLEKIKPEVQQQAEREIRLAYV